MNELLTWISIIMLGLGLIMHMLVVNHLIKAVGAIRDMLLILFLMVRR